jgi:(S)-2-hydroxy-acid oxidase
MNAQAIARRKLIKYLAASPFLATLLPAQLLAASQIGGSSIGSNLSGKSLFTLIKDPTLALDVFDFERVAKSILPPAHWGYMTTGTDADETLHANRKAFEKIYLRALRMVDTSNIDTNVNLLGQKLTSPIILAPVGSQRAFHPEGEIAVAKAARSRDHLQILSNVTTSSIEDVMAARGGPVWMQLYPTSNFAVGKKIVERAEKAGAPAIVLTVDLNSGSKRVMMDRYMDADTRDCSNCHDVSSPERYFDRKPMYLDTGAKVEQFDDPGMTWDYIGRLKEITTMKVVIKGIVTEEDAKSAIKHGADAIIVSNHGGRAEASGWGTLDSLPEVVNAVNGQVPVMIDSGFRRGTDIFKALAMGADAVCIGRPYLWGLSAFGQAGVESVLDILRAELAMVMGQMGTPSIKDINNSRIGRH